MRADGASSEDSLEDCMPLFLDVAATAELKISAYYYLFILCVHLSNDLTYYSTCWCSQLPFGGI